MSRLWLIRIVGIVMLIVFAIVFFNLYSRLSELQHNRRPAASQNQ